MARCVTTITEIVCDEDAEAGDLTGASKQEDQNRLRTLSSTGLNDDVEFFLYVVGGDDPNKKGEECSIERFNYQTLKWEHVIPRTPCTRTDSAGIALFDDEIWVVGGYRRGHAVSSVQIFNPHQSRWRDGPTLQYPRRYFGLAVLDGILYAAGGYQGDFCPDNVRKESLVSRTTELCHSAHGDWQFGESMLQDRKMFTLLVVQDMLYAVGGKSIANMDIPNMESYDPRTSQWSLIEDALKYCDKPFGVGVGAVGEEIYLLGCDGERCVMTINVNIGLEHTKYDIVREPREFPAVLNAGRRLFVFGGEYFSILSNTVEYYDADLDAWMDMPPMLRPRSSAGASLIMLPPTATGSQN